MTGAREFQTYVITFGRFGIRNGWVEVEAYDEAIARAWAQREYGSAWSSIYDEAEWSAADAALFPRGQLGRTRLHYDNADHV